MFLVSHGKKLRQFWIDCEFMESPGKVELISIGIVDEDDNELYCINEDAKLHHANDFVKRRVIPHLPPKEDDDADPYYWMSPQCMADEILKFVGPAEKDEQIVFWGYFSSYDWVCFCQIFGFMVNLPKGWPQYCMDIRSILMQIGNPGKPRRLMNAVHTAIEDAKRHKLIWRWAHGKWLEALSRHVNEQQKNMSRLLANSQDAVAMTPKENSGLPPIPEGAMAFYPRDRLALGVQAPEEDEKK